MDLKEFRTRVRMYLGEDFSSHFSDESINIAGEACKYDALRTAEYLVAVYREEKPDGMGRST